MSTEQAEGSRCSECGEVIPNPEGGYQTICTACTRASVVRIVGAKSGVLHCQCCASPLGQKAVKQGIERVICDKCLGFLQRWMDEIEAKNGTPYRCRKELRARNVEEREDGLVKRVRVSDIMVSIDDGDPKFADFPAVRLNGQWFVSAVDPMPSLLESEWGQLT